MLFQLPDGRTVEMSLNDYLDFSDTELHQLIGYAHIGDYIHSPSYGSAITRSSIQSNISQFEEDYYEEDE